MWTPRRVGLLLLGVVVLVAAYVVYQFFLGGYDGLPALPDKYLARGGSEQVTYRPSTTIGQLRIAFGENSPEASSDVRVYKHRLPIVDRNGVMAIGSPVTDGTPRVVVAPVSVALFGARNAKVRPGEQAEATTIHADRSVITFDRPINRMEDMTTAKMVRLDLESEPDDDPKALAETKRDPRQGRIWVTNNRKSPDPADHLVLRTPGPLFVQLPNDDAPESPDAKHIWTAASVEVFDRRNLPRRLRAREAELAKWPDSATPRSAVSELLLPTPIPPVAAVVSADDPRRYSDDLRRYADDLRRFNAVADILAGRTLPPPTAVGRGMSVRLAQAKREPNAPKQPSSFSGVHDLTLGEGVLMCLWTDGNAGFPGEASEPPKPAAASPGRPPSPNADPPLALAAVGGGLIDGGTIADRFEKRSLLVISTPGAFLYDLEKSFATFDAAAIAPDGGQNYVVVTRLNARNQTDDLICTRLELDLSDPDKGKAATPGSNPVADGGAVVIRQMTASGPMVTLSAQAEGVEASCVKLVHTRDRKTSKAVTVLHGTTEVPVVAKQGGSKLTAGDAVTAAVVTLTGQDPPPGSPDPRRETTAGVVGPGRLEMIERDPDTGAVKSSVAQWARRLDHEKWRNGKGGRVLDLLKFQEDAAFVDPAASFSLRAGDIWLWVSNKPGDPKSRSTGAAGSTPEQLIATTDVHLDSTELVIRKTNKLTAWFDDIPTPKRAAPPPPAAPVVPVPPAVDPKSMPVPVPPAGPGGGPPPPVPGGGPAPAPAGPPAEPIPNPVHLQADIVEAWLGRYPEPPADSLVPPAAPGKAPAPAPVAPTKPASPRVKYELLKARCDENVVAHQDPDPNDPAKPANGMDATGDKLIVENTPGGGGSVLTVTVRDDRQKLAMVAFEDTTMWGPVVVIDQPNNTASVAGRGKLRSLTTSDVAGNELSSPSELVVDWTERMKFEGAKAFAVFVGGVTVQQKADGDKPRAVPPPAVEVGPVAKREVLPLPRDAGPLNTATTKTLLWCHQLDLTLDRPVYFNQTRKTNRNKANRAANEPSPKVKSAVAVPDPAAVKAGDKYVIFQELTTAPTGAPLKARMLTSRQMDFDNGPKEQKLFATGPGEFRLLQPHKSDEEKGKPAPAVAAKDDGEMKLTLVTFQHTMTAIDQGNGLYQEATFDKGGVALRTPTAELLLPLEPHTLPPRSEYLRSEDKLIVSSSKTKKDADPNQRLTAIGNAEFRDDTRTGLGDKIVFDGTRVTLESILGRMASLYSNKRAVTQQQTTRAKKFVYNSVTGVIELTESSGGTILPGGK